MIFDAHAHVYAETIAERAVASIRDFYDLPLRCDGTPSTLLSIGNEYGVSKFLIHSVAMTPRQIRHIDEFIAHCVDSHPDRFVGFGTVHPDSNTLVDDIDYAISLGLQGVKIHPDMQKFALDEPRALRMFEMLEEKQVPVFIHTGDKRFPFSNPSRMANVMHRFPKLTAICAHLGGWSEWDEAAECLTGTGVYVDTSSSMYALKPSRMVEIIRAFGVDHVLYGSDYPMWNPGHEAMRLRTLPLTESEKAKILYLNAKTLFNL